MKRTKQSKVALLTGVTVQDGAYLAELRLDKGYEVHGIKRRARLSNPDRSDHLFRILGLEKKTRFYQASTSELYGLMQEVPQIEKTPFYPRSPYAVAKLYAYWTTVNYREAYGLYACNGILFNHESPLRGETFVTRKITRAMARIALGLQECLYLGNLSALRDWGHAKDYVEMKWLMLQQEQPEDFVIATGVQYNVRQFVEMAAAELGIELRFQGAGLDEVGVVRRVQPVGGELLASCKPGDVIVKVDPRYFRPAEVDTLLGDPGKAKRRLGWEPLVTLVELVSEMTLSDYAAAKRDRMVKRRLASGPTTTTNEPARQEANPMKMTVASSGYKGWLPPLCQFKRGGISSGDTFARDGAILLETGSLGTGHLVSIENSFE